MTGSKAITAVHQALVHELGPSVRFDDGHRAEHVHGPQREEVRRARADADAVQPAELAPAHDGTFSAANR